MNPIVFLDGFRTGRLKELFPDFRPGPTYELKSTGSLVVQAALIFGRALCPKASLLLSGGHLMSWFSVRLHGSECMQSSLCVVSISASFERGSLQSPPPMERRYLPGREIDWCQATPTRQSSPDGICHLLLDTPPVVWPPIPAKTPTDPRVRKPMQPRLPASCEPPHSSIPSCTAALPSSLLPQTIDQLTRALYAGLTYPAPPQAVPFPVEDIGRFLWPTTADKSPCAVVATCSSSSALCSGSHKGVNSGSDGSLLGTLKSKKTASSLSTGAGFNELWKRSALFLGTVGGALWLTRTRFRATSANSLLSSCFFVVCRLKRTCDPLGLVSFERAGLNLGPHFTPEDTSGEMQYCGCSFVFDFFERLLVFTGASLQRCMREILIARAPMRRLFEVFDWFNTKTTRSGVAQSFTLSTKRFVLCELDTVILVRSFKAVPLLSPNSPLFLGKHAGPLFSADYFANFAFGHCVQPETRAPDPHGFARVPHLGHCASLALHLALHCISRSLRLSGITPLKENETLDDLPGGAFPWPGYIGHFRGTTRTRASLPIALAQPAGFPSGFELRDGLLKARGTCLLGLGRVVLVTDHSDTVERSLCNSGSLPGGKSRAGASPGTHQVTLNAVIFLFGHGTRLELSH
ncbi:hypothetical protein PAPYR_11887 [Paratrimastix pyriformis]|uniref:Uncharacterized protein n=1 Tax=Paratrimastix pyriformis TaxID=342808 RepID=A0ABQ8U7M5_9EUKA|nr:hypothetical protein PAPYR_11887 [Paratrimastix pyriformis]